MSVTHEVSVAERIRSEAERHMAKVQEHLDAVSQWGVHHPVSPDHVLAAVRHVRLAADDFARATELEQAIESMRRAKP